METLNHSQNLSGTNNLANNEVEFDKHKNPLFWGFFCVKILDVN